MKNYVKNKNSKSNYPIDLEALTDALKNEMAIKNVDINLEELSEQLKNLNLPLEDKNITNGDGGVCDE